MTLHSMTAFGCGECNKSDYAYNVEIRTLNSRFIEVNVRMPRHLIALETEIINTVKSTLHRGKVDVFVDVQRESGSRDLPELDQEVVSHYGRLVGEISTLVKSATGNSDMRDPVATDFLRLDGVFKASERKSRSVEAAGEFKDGIMTALKSALENVIKARQVEGEALNNHLVELAESLQADRDAVANLRESVLEDLMAGVKKRFEQVLAQLQKSGGLEQEVSKERIAAEVALISDKADIEEEVARLATHIQEFHKTLALTEPVGRKLDFLCQEMHREVNTMSNKLVQTEVSKHTVPMKQTVERIRQQVQNIE